MGGLELRTRLATQYPQFKVILMSGYASDVDAPADAPHRIGDWLAKPFSIDALATKLADVLGR